ncbi:hypothetical protein NQ318_000135 [Aromia moschata]|uniref:FHA domain-containing protein n=1 Tax=Aromia moschata TaxID=1265417 RepID=A0AAV8XIL6_9CUCU|nr:hypothetical protein NQ318_000135 [Aromia moschata]
MWSAAHHVTSSSALLTAPSGGGQIRDVPIHISVPIRRGIQSWAHIETQVTRTAQHRLYSCNGTFVNNQKIPVMEMKSLNPGDIVGFGVCQNMGDDDQSNVPLIYEVLKKRSCYF